MATEITTILAAWGALVATANVTWTIFFANNPRIHAFAQNNMRQVLIPQGQRSPLVAFSTDALPEQEKYFVITVSNRGNKDTRIQYIQTHHYRFHFFKSRLCSGKVIAADMNVAGTLPFKLEPGNQLLFFCKQTSELEQHAKKGLLRFKIIHTASNSPKYCSLKL